MLLDNSFLKLIEHFKSQETAGGDTFCRSLPYYLLTGRSGAKAYHQNNAKVIVAQHPHDSNITFVFPEVNGNGDLTVKILNELAFEKRHVQLARYTEKDYSQLQEAIERDSLRFVKSILLKPEDIMDWKYPAHVIDTKKVAELKGKEFSKLRNKFNQASGKFDEIPLSHPDAIKNIRASIFIWVGLIIHSGNESGEDMTSFYQTLVKTIEFLPNVFDGFVLNHKGEPAGFSVWDNVDNTANALAGLSRRSMSGMSEYQIVNTCKKLQEAGIEHYNLGGSETSELDQFKLKFRPIDSISMSTYDVDYYSLENTDVEQFTLV